MDDLEGLLRELDIRSMLDIPCGDFNWMKKLDLEDIDYHGADIVAELVKKNNLNYGSPSVKFSQLDITRHTLPKVDLVFCRDCLVHLPMNTAKTAIRNVLDSGSKYFACTTYPDHHENTNVKLGGWYPMNIEDKPFSFERPDFIIDERCKADNGRFPDKSIAVWKINE